MMTFNQFILRELPPETNRQMKFIVSFLPWIVNRQVPISQKPLGHGMASRDSEMQCDTSAIMVPNERQKAKKR